MLNTEFKVTCILMHYVVKTTFSQIVRINEISMKPHIKIK